MGRKSISESVSLILAGVLIGLAADVEVRAQKAGESIHIGYSTSSGAASSLWVTQDAGFFRKNGLEAELIYMQGGTRVMQGVVSGSLEVGWGGGPDVIGAQLSGADVNIIAAINDTIPYKLIVGKQITKPEQLKGQKIAVSSIGSTSHYGAKMALKHLGLDPERDVAAIAVGSDLARLAALEAGAVQATAVEPVTAMIAQKRGYGILIDLTTQPLRYLAQAIVARNSFIDRHAETCRRLIKAVVEGIHFLKVNPQESKSIIAQRMRIKDAEIVEANYTLQGVKRTLSKPVPTDEAIQAILDMLGERNPKARTAQPQQFVDLRFIRELEASGFIDALYRRGP